jgi:hypothetical protein
VVVGDAGYDVTLPGRQKTRTKLAALATLGLEWARRVNEWDKFVVNSGVLT